MANAATNFLHLALRTEPDSAPVLLKTDADPRQHGSLLELLGYPSTIVEEPQENAPQLTVLVNSAHVPTDDEEQVILWGSVSSNSAGGTARIIEGDRCLLLDEHVTPQAVFQVVKTCAKLIGQKFAADKKLENLQSKLIVQEDLYRRSMTDKGSMLIDHMERAKSASIRDAELSTVDLATGLLRHGQFHHRLGFEVERSATLGQPLTLLLADVDNFSEYNHTHGYQAGERALQQVGKSLKTIWMATPAPRPPILGREAGDRFAAILPDAGAEEAEGRAESLRSMVERLPITPQRLTVSIGCVSSRDGKQTRAELVKRAYEALGEAQRNGGNKVCILLAKS